jgi:hypothetical protein
MAHRARYTRDGDAQVRPTALGRRDQRRGGGDRRPLVAAGSARGLFGNRRHFRILQERFDDEIASTSSPTASGE